LQAALRHLVTPKLTVVISTLGNHALLRRVLDGYERQDAAAGSWEMIVVSDLAEEDPAAVDAAVGERPYPVRRITGRVAGLSANRNTAWPLAQAPIVLFTDNDTIPVPGLVREHIDWHERYPDEHVAVVGHVRWAPELKRTSFMHWLDHGMQFDYPNIEGIEAGWGRLYGANSSLKTSFIAKVGDWEEKYLPYLYDDVEWNYRASAHGLRVLYNRDAIVDHVRHDTTLEFWKKKMRLVAIRERTFVALHPEMKPWFHGMFTQMAGAPRASGRGRHLIRFVPKWVPLLGPRAWHSADVYWKQQLAPYFLEAWEEADQDPLTQGAIEAGRRAQEALQEASRDAAPG
jgi:GT2 family glycosyltransferase